MPVGAEHPLPLMTKDATAAIAGTHRQVLPRSTAFRMAMETDLLSDNIAPAGGVPETGLTIARGCAVRLATPACRVTVAADHHALVERTASAHLPHLDSA